MRPICPLSIGQAHGFDVAVTFSAGSIHGFLLSLYFPFCHCQCAEVSSIRVISIESVCLVTPPLVISLSSFFTLMNSLIGQVPPFVDVHVGLRRKRAKCLATSV